MKGTNNLHKNIFLALLKIAQKFHYFCKVRAYRISVKNSILQKLPKNCGEILLLMRGTNNLHKNIFLALLKIAQKFHYFCKVRACRISVKKFNFTKIRQARTLQKYWNFCAIFNSAKKIFLCKLFVPLIKRSATPQF